MNVTNASGAKVNYEIGVIDWDRSGFSKSGVLPTKIYYWKSILLKEIEKLAYRKNFIDLKITTAWNLYLLTFWMWNCVTAMKGLKALNIGVTDTVNLEITI